MVAVTVASTASVRISTAGLAIVRARATSGISSAPKESRRLPAQPVLQAAGDHLRIPVAEVPLLRGHAGEQPSPPVRVGGRDRLGDVRRTLEHRGKAFLDARPVEQAAVEQQLPSCMADGPARTRRQAGRPQLLAQLPDSGRELLERVEGRVCPVMQRHALPHRLGQQGPLQAQPRHGGEVGQSSAEGHIFLERAIDDRQSDTDMGDEVHGGSSFSSPRGSGPVTPQRPERLPLRVYGLITMSEKGLQGKWRGFPSACLSATGNGTRLVRPVLLKSLSSLSLAVLSVVLTGTMAGAATVASGAGHFTPIRTRQLTTADPLDANTAIAYQYFVTHTSLTPVQVAGLEGNLLYESGGALNPAQIQFGCTLPPDYCGAGIAQWTDPGPRFSALEALARSEGVAWSTLNVQLQFVWRELTGTYAGAGSTLEGCSTTTCSTSVVEDDYEIPADPPASYQARLANANEILSAYGVTLTSPISVAPNADGDLQMFAIGDNGQSYSSWQTAPNGSWTPWAPLGGAFPLPAAAPVAVAPNADGRLELFVVGRSGQTYSSWQTTPNGHWTSWAPLEDTFQLPPGDHLSAARDTAGEVHLFTVAGNGQSYSKSQTTPNGHWTQWTALGGIVELPAAAPASVAPNADGRLQLFVVGGNGQAYTSWQVRQTGNWAAWSPLGGASALPPAAPIAVAPNPDGRLQAFVVGTNGQTYSSWQQSPNGQWSPWAALGGTLALPAGAPLSAARDAGGELQLFAVSTGGQAYFASQSSANGNWNPWAALGGGLALPPAAPVTVAANADGRLQAFAVNSVGQSYSSWQSGLTGSWTTWSPLGGVP